MPGVQLALELLAFSSTLNHGEMYLIHWPTF
jgi:hypothetical protein